LLFDITKFDEYREDNRREVKAAKDTLPNSLWETYSSFANCYGGVIILGVKENKDGTWHATGIEKVSKVLKEFWDNINNRKVTNVNILTDSDVEVYEDENTGNSIIVINVPPASRTTKPVYIKGDIWNGTYRRNWEGDYHCSQAEIKAMLRDQPDDTMDMKVIEELSIEHLNKNSIQGYRNRHRLSRPGHPWNSYSDADYLEMIGAAAIGKDKQLHPTAAGLLMFGDEYRIVREFPEYFLDYREMLDPSIRWTDRFYSSTGEWSGNLFDFYFGVYNRIIRDLKVPFKMVGGERVDDTPVHKALREALANCLVNTDFYTSRGVVIKKDAEKIVMENPGYIRVGKSQMRKGGESDPRNKNLMKMFNLIDIGERAGSGVPELYTVWSNEGWEEPSFEERFGDAARTVLLLSMKKKLSSQNKKSADKKAPIKSADKKASNKKIDSQIELIIGHMSDGELYSSKELGEILGVKDSRTKTILRKMVDEGLIMTEGNNRNRKYKIK